MLYKSNLIMHSCSVQLPSSCLRFTKCTNMPLTIVRHERMLEQSMWWSRKLQWPSEWLPVSLRWVIFRNSLRARYATIGIKGSKWRYKFLKECHQCSNGIWFVMALVAQAPRERGAAGAPHQGP